MEVGGGVQAPQAQSHPRGVWGHAPPEFFFKFDARSWVSGASRVAQNEELWEQLTSLGGSGFI